MKRSLIEKVFINDDNIAKFGCPKCKAVKKINTSKYKERANSLRLKYSCKCGHVRIIQLERRRFFRKNVSLAGTFQYEGSKEVYPMIVKDISRTGLLFEVNDVSVITVDKKVSVEFRLDNQEKMQIRRNILIKNIKGFSIGGIFISDPSKMVDRLYEASLGYYTYPESDK